MAIELTDEIRAAVLAELCERDGHMVDVSKALNNYDGFKRTVMGPEEDVLPHLVCVRCRKTWLVIEQPADGYDAAEEQVMTALAPNHQIRNRIEGVRQRRKARKK